MPGRVTLVAVLLCVALSGCTGSDAPTTSDVDAATDRSDVVAETDAGEPSDATPASDGELREIDTQADDTPLLPGLGELGDRCATEEDCASEMCVRLPGDREGLCSTRCDDDCPVAFDCITVPPRALDPIFDDGGRVCVADGHCLDGDGDGYGVGGGCEGRDCRGSNAAIYEGAEERCDGLDGDCDGEIDEEPSDAGMACETGEHGACGSGQTVCDAGVLRCESTASPALEVCNGVDDDCDGEIDESDAEDATTWFRDADGDGVGTASETLTACESPAGYSEDFGDCDDSDADVAPGRTEVPGDGVDSNCDGRELCFVDIDGDGARAASAGADPVRESEDEDCDDEGEATRDAPLDCDDRDAETGPGSVERCDGTDNDCDGETDESDAVDAPTWYTDRDGDGAGDPSTAREACTPPSGAVARTGDCNDRAAAIGPDSDELCNGIDDDCDGAVDEDSAVDADTWYVDVDGDGFGDERLSRRACRRPEGFAAVPGDCVDTVPGVHPDAAELCDGEDNDCDGEIDGDDAVDAATWYEDPDGDGYGRTTSTLRSCEAPAGYAAERGDCDEDREAVNPGADELCNGIDDDCDSEVDEDDAVDAPLWYRDEDGDGYGRDDDPVAACTPPAEEGWAERAGDCNDLRPSIHPGADERCDRIDNDCDGATDEEGAVDAPTWYADEDGDGVGDGERPIRSCRTPRNAAAIPGDCDDEDPTINPFAEEIPGDGIDQNCDGAELCYVDRDGDGFREDDPVDPGSDGCTGEGFVDFDTPAGDCEDSDATVFPGADEQVGDERDQNCDGVEVCFVDADGDGHRTTETTESDDLDCDDMGEAPASQPADDCDDGDRRIHPGRTDTPADGIDSDCDGLEACYLDVDGDGYRTDSTILSEDLACDVEGLADDSLPGGDCDDEAAAVFPGAPEIAADGVDQDCDGFEECFADVDGDGYRTDRLRRSDSTACDGLGDARFDAPGGDCDDGSEAVHPGAEETVGDGRDSDCDGREICFEDRDGDLQRTDETVESDDTDCNDEGEARASAVAVDCNDDDATIFIGAVETPGDGVDQNCDGFERCFRDEDGDGYRTAETVASERLSCDGEGLAPADAPLGDCDDSDGQRNPSAEEIVGDEIDQDCDFSEICFRDADEDGFRTDETVASFDDDCQDAGEAIADSPAGDCNDTTSDANPGATEVCDLLDNDCDGTVDGPDAEGATPHYRDADGDAHGNPDELIVTCFFTEGYVTRPTDCDDRQSEIHPDAVEECDGIDNDCDGDIDEGAVATSTFYRDADGDGYGDAERLVAACVRPSGYVEDSRDCDDSTSAANPGATEICDGIDNDCDSVIDGTGASGAGNWYPDADGDGVGAVVTDPFFGCTPPAGHVRATGDCNDADADVHPGHAEICDGIDNDCNSGTTDVSACGGCLGLRWGGHAYRFCNAARSWDAAQADCIAVGMRLVRIDSRTENDFVRVQAASNGLGRLWLGGRHSVDGSRIWVWPDREELCRFNCRGGNVRLFTHWKSGEPNNDGREYCMELRDDGVRNDGEWNDKECWADRDYVCERW